MELCKSLLQRCNRLQRILSQHPDNLERLDPELVGRLFEFLNRANDLIKCVAFAIFAINREELLVDNLSGLAMTMTGTTAPSLRWADCCEREA